MADWCNDCAWPVECAAARDCQRRRQGEVRGEGVAEPDGGVTAALLDGGAGLRPWVEEFRRVARDYSHSVLSLGDALRAIGRQNGKTRLTSIEISGVDPCPELDGEGA
ncbi:MAG: hypothetical protein IPK75_01495 [Acidobacteria bacterium]|nr:hypothetical protein [Acidobacteriota bacterium]